MNLDRWNISPFHYIQGEHSSAFRSPSRSCLHWNERRSLESHWNDQRKKGYDQLVVNKQIWLPDELRGDVKRRDAPKLIRIPLQELVLPVLQQEFFSSPENFENGSWELKSLCFHSDTLKLIMIILYTSYTTYFIINTMLYLLLYTQVIKYTILYIQYKIYSLHQC